MTENRLTHKNSDSPRAIARELAAGVVADYRREHFMDDFEACIAYLRFPVNPSPRDRHDEFT
jgi:hypothetical protein